MRLGRRRPVGGPSPRVIGPRVRLPALLLGFALVYGTLGYRLIEGLGWVDAFYMTATTLTTVGFGEVEPLSQTGRLFTISLIAVGIVAVFDLVAVFTSQVASGDLVRTRKRRAMHRKIEAMRDHFVICAYGRVGRAAVRELVRQRSDVVVIETDPALEFRLEEAGVAYLIADPSEESVLEQAGIRHARALLCAVDSDAMNVYITLTARALQPDLYILARASSPESVDKLTRAGANRVVSPYLVSGTRMASMALRPALLDFMDMISLAPDLHVEEVIVGERSALASRTVQDACAPYDGVTLLAVRDAAGHIAIPPRAETVLRPGDLLIAAGPGAGLMDLAQAAT